MNLAGTLHIVHGVLSLDVGGLERLVLSLVREGVRRGHRVSVVCLERRGQLAPEAEAAGATVVSLDKPPGRHPAFIGRAAAALAELKPDVVHSHQIGVSWYLGQAARERRGGSRTPVIHTEHGNHFARLTGWWAGLKARLFVRSAARVIDRFCCVSDEIAAAVTRWGTVPRAKVEVIPNGIPTEVEPGLPEPAAVRDSLGIPPDAPVVGTVGRLVEVKRQDLLIRALARLREQFPTLRLVLVGDGPERASLGALARELGLTDRVHFAGYQSRPEQFLRIMSVFCLTSRSEGFPVSLLEAWREELPVVCSAVGGIPAVVTHRADGLLFRPGEEEALATALAELLGDRDLATRLGRAGAQTLRGRYSLERVVDEYERRYRELRAGPGPLAPR